MVVFCTMEIVSVRWNFIIIIIIKWFLSTELYVELESFLLMTEKCASFIRFSWKWHFNRFFPCFRFQYPVAATFWKLNYDHQQLAQAHVQAAQQQQQQWTNNIQTSDVDAGALIYISMPSSQYPNNAHEDASLINAHTNNQQYYVAHRNQLFAKRPIAKKSIIQQASVAQSIPSSELQYSSYIHSPATAQVQPNQHQYHQQQIANQATIAPFSNAVDEYLLHGEMPLPQDQTYIVSNAAPNIAINVEPDYLT